MQKKKKRGRPPKLNQKETQTYIDEFQPSFLSIHEEKVYRNVSNDKKQKKDEIKIKMTNNQNTQHINNEIEIIDKNKCDLKQLEIEEKNLLEQEISNKVPLEQMQSNLLINKNKNTDHPNLIENHFSTTEKDDCESKVTVTEKRKPGRSKLKYVDENIKIIENKDKSNSEVLYSDMTSTVNSGIQKRSTLD